MKTNNIRLQKAELIKQKRSETGMTQEELGEAIGTSRSQVTNIETSASGMTVEMLYQISTALSCSPAELLPLSGIYY